MEQITLLNATFNNPLAVGEAFGQLIEKFNANNPGRVLVSPPQHHVCSIVTGQYNDRVELLLTVQFQHRPA